MAILVLTPVVAFSFLAAGARAYGRRVPPSPSHLESGDCGQPPCWEGIKPGVSSRWETERQTFRWMTDPSAFFNSPYMGSAIGTGDNLEQLVLHTWGSPLTLANILREFGAPESASCVCEIPGSKVPGWRESIALEVELYFYDGQMEVSVILPEGIARLTPTAPVYGVYYYAADADRGPLATTPWRGLAMRGSYPTCPSECVSHASAH